MIDIESLRSTYKRYQGESFAANAVLNCCGEIERLQQALEDYGEHLSTCSKNGRLGEGAECTCGFEEILERGK